MKKLRIMVLLGSSHPFFSNQYISARASTVSRSCAEAGTKGESCCRSLPPSILQHSCLTEPNVTHFCQVRFQPSQCLPGLPCAKQCQHRGQGRAEGKGLTLPQSWGQPERECCGSSCSSSQVSSSCWMHPTGCASWHDKSQLLTSFCAQTPDSYAGRSRTWGTLFSIFCCLPQHLSCCECSVWKQSAELPIQRVVTARASAGAVHPMPAANISARWEALQQFESGPVTQEEQEAGSTILVLVLSSLALLFLWSVLLLPVIYLLQNTGCQARWECQA